MSECAERLALLAEGCAATPQQRAVRAASRSLHARTCPTCRARFEALPVDLQDDERDRLTAAMDAGSA